MIEDCDPNSLRARAQVAEAEGRIADAIALLRTAIETAPRFAPAHAELAQLLQRNGRSDEALRLLDVRIRQFPDVVWPLSIKAAVLDGERQTEQSLCVHRDIVARAPHISVAWLNYGNALRALGRTDEAIGVYRKTIELEPYNGAAWWALASIENVLGTTDVEQLERALENADEVQRVPLHFSLGRALENAGDFERSFRQYEAGNRLRTALTPPASAGVDELVADSETLFTRQFFAERAGGGCAGRAPIFIVGMPRSGSTLFEQMLANHPQVEALGELPHMEGMARELGGVAGIASLAPDVIASLGERYFASVARYRKTGRPYFTDKLPANWQWLGLIALILPNAKIIDVRREPQACCFANFAFYFNSRTNLAEDLEDVARYYLAYARMIEHFATAAPGQLLTISYERLVDDPKVVMQKVLSFLNLSFSSDCIQPFGHERAIHTPSAEQVRQPLHGRANQRWHSYQQWLTSLIAALSRG